MNTYSNAIRECMAIPYTRDNGIQLLDAMKDCLTDYRCSCFEEQAAEYLTDGKMYELQLLLKECHSLICDVGGWKANVIAWGKGSERNAKDFWDAYLNLCAIYNFVSKCVAKTTPQKN